MPRSRTRAFCLLAAERAASSRFLFSPERTDEARWDAD